MEAGATALAHRANLKKRSINTAKRVNTTGAAELNLEDEDLELHLKWLKKGSPDKAAVCKDLKNEQHGDFFVWRNARAGSQDWVLSINAGMATVMIDQSDVRHYAIKRSMGIFSIQQTNKGMRDTKEKNHVRFGYDPNPASKEFYTLSALMKHIINNKVYLDAEVTPHRALGDREATAAQMRADESQESRAQIFRIAFAVLHMALALALLIPAHFTGRSDFASRDGISAIVGIEAHYFYTYAVAYCTYFHCKTAFRGSNDHRIGLVALNFSTVSSLMYWVLYTLNKDQNEVEEELPHNFNLAVYVIMPLIMWMQALFISPMFRRVITHGLLVVYAGYVLAACLVAASGIISFGGLKHKFFQDLDTSAKLITLGVPLAMAFLVHALGYVITQTFWGRPLR